MLQPLLLGIALSALTIIVHALGTIWWIDSMKRNYGTPTPLISKPGGKKKDFQFRDAMYVLGVTSSLLVVLHVVEVCIWGFSYLLLPQLDSLDSIEEAIYFSVVTFASLGYGDIVIEGPWRILSGIEAMAGNLVFGWSSALLLAAFLQMMGDRLEVAEPEPEK